MMPDSISVWPTTQSGDHLFGNALRFDERFGKQLRSLRATSAGLVPQVYFDQLVHSPAAWLAAAVYAYAAYRANRFEPELADWLECKVVAWKHKSMEGFCAQLERFDVVAIAGSNDWDDWRMNRKWQRAAWFCPTIGHLNVHAGFIEAFESASIGLERFLHRRVGRPVLFIGHSLGAAVAQMLMLSREWIEGPSASIVFASPRIGCRQFARELERHWSMHLWNVGDFVPHLPPWLSGYRHPNGKARYVARDGSIYRGRVAVLGDLCVNTLRHLGMLPFPNFRFCFSAVEAHSLVTSINRISRWM